MCSILCRFAVLLLIAAGSILPVISQSMPTDGVRLHNGRDGTGPAQDIPAGTYQVDGKQLDPGETGKPNISVRVPAGVHIRFCENKDGSGKCEEFGEGVHNLTSADFNFIRVWKGSPTLQPVPTAPTTQAPAAAPKIAALTAFEQKHWLGRSQTFAPGMFRSFRGEFGKINDNQVRSIIVAKGFRVRLCSDEGLMFRGSGDCEIHEEGRHNLRFANSISFIEVRDLSDTSPDDEEMPVVLFEDASQAGVMQGFGVGTFLASSGGFGKLGNDRASSIEVKTGYRATVCADEPSEAGGTGSNCEDFAAGRKNLRNRKGASWMRVERVSN